VTSSDVDLDVVNI